MGVTSEHKEATLIAWYSKNSTPRPAPATPRYLNTYSVDSNLIVTVIAAVDGILP